MARRINYPAKLAAAAKNLELAQQRRDDLIREAAEKGGMTRRQIADACGLSFARVQQIVATGRDRP
jgi:hypothetical protein